MITIGLLVVLWRRDEPRAGCAGLASRRLALVIFQGVLGGMRVLLDERTLAMLHGCTGPLFFALTVAHGRVHVAAVASEVRPTPSSGGPIRALGRRDVHPGLPANRARRGASPRAGRRRADDVRAGRAIPSVPRRGAVAAHRAAGVSRAAASAARSAAWRLGRDARGAACRCNSLLGAGTWIVKFAVPAWAAAWMPPMTTAIQDGGWLQTHIITAHVAVGSLLLVTSLALALYAQRLLAAPAATRRVAPPSRLEAAV